MRTTSVTHLVYPNQLSEHAIGKWPGIQQLPPVDAEQLHHPFELGE
jgi:hypothetical protein